MAKKFFSKAWSFVVVLFRAVADAIDSVPDASDAKPPFRPQRGRTFELPPEIPVATVAPLAVSLPVVPPVIEIPPLVEAVSETAIVLAEDLVVEQPPVEQLVSEVVPEPMVEVHRVPVKLSLAEAKYEALEHFYDYVYTLQAEDFSEAAEQREALLKDRIGNYQIIWLVAQLIEEGKLKTYIPEGTQFRWKEGYEMNTSPDWLDVPAKKRATALLFALRDFYGQQASEEQKLQPMISQGEESSQKSQLVKNGWRDPGSGFSGRRTGKTEKRRLKLSKDREEALRQERRENRPCPQGVAGSTPPRHGKGKKKK